MSDEELIARLRENQAYEWQDPIWETRLAAADRIEALTKELAAARDDAKEAEAYVEELEAARAERAKAVDRAIATLAKIKGESHE